MIEDADLCLRAIDGSDKIRAEQAFEKRKLIVVLIHLVRNLPCQVREHVSIIKEYTKDVLATEHGCQAADIDILVLLDC